MAYLPEERETVIRYDELDNCWYFETSVRRHITKILKTESAFEQVEKELDERNNCIYVRAKLTNLEDFSVNPFVKNKLKLTEEQRRKRAEQLKRNLR